LIGLPTKEGTPGRHEPLPWRHEPHRFARHTEPPTGSESLRYTEKFP